MFFEFLFERLMSSKFSKLWQYSLKETLQELSILTWIILFYTVIIVKAWQNYFEYTIHKNGHAKNFIFNTYICIYW